MRIKDTHTLHTATARAKTLRRGAFCKYSSNSQRIHRYQVLLEKDGETWLVASAPSWVEALEAFWHWHNNNPETGGAAPPTPGEAGNGTAATKEA